MNKKDGCLRLVVDARVSHLAVARLPGVERCSGSVLSWIEAYGAATLHPVVDTEDLSYIPTGLPEPLLRSFALPCMLCGDLGLTQPCLRVAPMGLS